MPSRGLVLVIRRGVRACELDVDEELHDRGRQVLLCERVRVEDGREAVGRVPAARVVVLFGHKVAEQLGERGAKVRILDVPGRADESDHESDEVVQLRSVHLLERLRRECGDVLEEVSHVTHAVLGQRREKARNLLRQRQTLGRRARSRDEPARDEPEVAHAARHECRIGQMRLVCEHALLDCVDPLFELRHLGLELGGDAAAVVAARAQPHELLLADLQVLVPAAVLLLQLFEHRVARQQPHV